MFEALGVTASGMNVHKKWMDAISDNVANVNTVRRTTDDPFRSRYVIAQALEDGGTGGGVAVAGIELSKTQSKMAYSPDHPLADENGYVRAPDIDMGSQMSQLIMAQRGFQASVSTTKHAQDTYAAALQIGR